MDCHSGLSQSIAVNEVNGTTRSCPIVIGLYGLPGSGKSTLLSKLKEHLDPSQFSFYEGSEQIAAICPDGLTSFQSLNQRAKSAVREQAIRSIADDSAARGCIAVVAGHLMFWDENQSNGDVVWTPGDAQVFTHVIYLQASPYCIANRCLNDIKPRATPSIQHLRTWQQAEIQHLRDLCSCHGILLSVLRQEQDGFSTTVKLLQHFQFSSAESNSAKIKASVDAIFAGEHHPETVLVLDADKTLAAEDSSVLLWEAMRQLPDATCGEYPLKSLFSGPMGYSDQAFWQSMLLYENAASEDDFNAACCKAAASITLYDEIQLLLRLVSGHRRVRALVVTCGPRRVWESVLERTGLSQTIQVIGTGRLVDGIIVTPSSKALVVNRLRQRFYVCAFGDSPLDIPMLEAADQAIVITGCEGLRSKSMDAALAAAVASRGLKAQQVCIPVGVSPRLSIRELPVVTITSPDFLNSVFCRGFDAQRLRPSVVHYTDSAIAKLLMSPSRDASVSGPVLRQAHKNIGRYLATDSISKILGVEEYSIPHVQGHHTPGYRLSSEKQTLIVALMRGGEPMALGISAVFPKAAFLHASSAADINDDNTRVVRNLILVDSVINTGKSIVQFLEQLRKLQRNLRVVVVAGVVQAECVADGSSLMNFMKDNGTHLVALRLSKNKFTGVGSTDTGNRLFNTTFLD